MNEGEREMGARSYMAYWAQVLAYDDTELVAYATDDVGWIEVRHGGIPVKDRWAEQRRDR